MKLEATFLRSKVARRMFLLFVVCALLPIGATAFISFTLVTSQLSQQSQDRQQRAAKATALGIYQRLLFVETEMKRVGALFEDSARASFKGGMLREWEEDLKRRFQGLALISDGARPRVLFGRLEHPPAATLEESSHLKSGRTALAVEHRAQSSPRIFMRMALDPAAAAPAILAAEINPAFLWGTGEENALPPMTDLHILDSSARALFSTRPAPDLFFTSMTQQLQLSSSGKLDWESGGHEHLASYWSIPLKYRFFTPQWTVVLSEPRATILAPLDYFKRTFPYVLLLSLWLVLLLSTSQIRRSLVPLEQLREGTRRIAMRDFKSQVAVSSKDEFEELAQSFNQMASQLGKQFGTLATISEIDRAILSALDTEKILDTILSRIRDVFPCDHASVSLFHSDDRGRAETYYREQSGTIAMRPIRLTTEAILETCRDREAPFTVHRSSAPSLEALFVEGLECLLVIPMFIQGRLSGIIALGHNQCPPEPQIDTDQARQLADQVAVAIHNSRLYKEIKNQAEELARANKVKDEFLSVMSHELRTPLSVVMGYSELVREGALGELTQKQENALDLIMQRSTDLLNLINSVMEVTKLEAGAVVVEKHDIRLGDFLDQLKLAYRLPSTGEIEIQWDYSPDLPPIYNDSTKIRQILQSLIDNAIKFTPEGQVTLSVRYDPGSGQIVFKVSDTGIGIPKEAMGIIFEKFRQLDSSEKRAYAGVGLGLFIAKRFTDLLGGSIGVESKPGVGSTFTVRIPCAH